MRVSTALLLAITAAACVGSPPAPCTACGTKCVDVQTDPANCGTCGTACAAGKLCVTGTCKDTCPSGQQVCSSKCVDTRNDNAHCGACGTACPVGEVCSGGTCAATCAPPLVVCNGKCVDTAGDIANCGACGTTCSPRNALAPACIAGRCSYSGCLNGYSDCDGMRENGCEADTSSDPLNCGACANICRPTNVSPRPLDAGVDAGVSDAGTDAGVADGGAPDAGPPCGPLPDGGNAGACPLQPPSPGTWCRNSGCGYESCATGFADCDGVVANGCEAQLAEDPKNCGGCGRRCDGPGESCTDSECYGTRRSIASPDFVVNIPAVTIRQARVSLAAEPGATIHYTNNGSTPVPGAAGTTSVPASPGPGVDMTYGNLKYYATWPDGRRDALHVYAHALGGDPCQRGGILENFAFTATNSAVAQVARGATVTGSFSANTWRSNVGCYCPGCITQWVLSLATTGQVQCFNNSGGTYPGQTSTQNFSFTAPMTPGRYLLRWGVTDQNGCATAGAPGGPNVGMLIVQ